MLPPRRVHDPAEVFAWERRHFLGGGWTCVAHGAAAARAGRQLAVDTGSGGVLLIRGEDGVVRAFANTCRHRGHELLPCGSIGHREGHRLPVPLWAYELSGELRGAPGFRDAPGFDPAAWSLRQLPAVEWHGLVFVDGSGGAAGPLPLAALERDRRAVRAGAAGHGRATHSYDAAANWKILTENYHECYHCPTIHPELCSVSARRTAARTTTSTGVLDRRLDVAARRRRDDVARRAQRRRAAARPVGGGAADGDLRGDLPERAAQPAPGLRHDARARAARGGPDADRVLVGVRAGGASSGPASTRRTPSTSGT